MKSIDTIVLKFASGCNLLCDYCYEYQSGDNTWKKKPSQLSDEIAFKIGKRINEYVLKFTGKPINIVAHGGEPLLLRFDRLKSVFKRLIEGAGRENINLIIQTNGTLITKEICSFIKKENIKVGISIDGNDDHNKYRVDHAGRPTFEKTVEGIDLVKTLAPNQFSGLIAVIDFNQEPEEVMRALLDHKPPVLDILQPFVTHDMLNEEDNRKTVDKFGEWMIKATNFWFDNEQYHGTSVRFIEDALKAVMGHPPKSDWFGFRKITYLIIETDGKYDLQDQLKVAGSNSANLRGLNKDVFTHSLLEAEESANELLLNLKGEKLPDDCFDCEFNNSCAGGFLPTRYSNKKIFNNASVYCDGIKSFMSSLNNHLNINLQSL